MVVVAAVIAVIVASYIFFREMCQKFIISHNSDAFELIGRYFKNLLCAVVGGHGFFVGAWGFILTFFKIMCKFLRIFTSSYGG
jgi:hypothetical protein